MLEPVLECGELYSCKVSSFRPKIGYIYTPLERNSLITILANPAFTSHDLQPKNMYCVLLCTTTPPGHMTTLTPPLYLHICMWVQVQFSIDGVHCVPETSNESTVTVMNIMITNNVLA